MNRAAARDDFTDECDLVLVQDSAFAPAVVLNAFEFEDNPIWPLVAAHFSQFPFVLYRYSAPLGSVGTASCCV